MSVRSSSSGEGSPARKQKSPMEARALSFPRVWTRPMRPWRQAQTMGASQPENSFSIVTLFSQRAKRREKYLSRRFWFFGTIGCLRPHVKVILGVGRHGGHHHRIIKEQKTAIEG